MQTLALPSTANAPARIWDPRLTLRGVALQSAIVEVGQAYWRLVVARWFSEQEAGGRHHIFIEALDEQGIALAGVRFLVTWPSGASVGVVNGRSGFDAGNFPMSASRNEFAVAMADGTPSDVVSGIGMGADTPGGFNAGIHTATWLVYQRATFLGAQTPPPIPPVPVEPPPPLPGTPDAVMDALAQARNALAAARNAIDRAMSLYSRQTGG